MKKINIAWNNTDWSVSNIGIRATNFNQRNLSMNYNTQTPTEKTARTFGEQNNRASLPAQAAQRHAAHGFSEVLKNARREAAALAWSTGFPFLTLPCLQEELENDATKYWSKQTRIQLRSSSLLNKTFPMASHLLAA